MSAISEKLALTALCVWEEILSIIASPDRNNAYIHKMESVGVSELRHLALHVIAPAVEVAFNSVKEDFDEPFDWEFVPKFLELAEPFMANNVVAIPVHAAEDIGRKIVSMKMEISANER